MAVKGTNLKMRYYPFLTDRRSRQLVTALVKSRRKVCVSLAARKQHDRSARSFAERFAIPMDR